MKREKRSRSRREKALRRLAAAIALAAALALLEGYCFLPSQAVRHCEESAHTGPTEVIKDLGALNLKNAGWSRAYLSVNDNAMLITLSRFYMLYGWVDYGMGALDCSEELPFHVSVYSVSKLQEEEDNWKRYLFGRVDDPAGEAVSVQARSLKTGEDIWETLTIPKSEWIVHKGCSYFIVEVPRFSREEYNNRIEIRAALLDGAGKVLAQEEDVQGWSTGLG